MRPFRALSGLLCASKAMLSAAAAIAGTSCGSVDVSIETKEAHLAERLCKLAENSVKSLAECNLSVPLPLQIEVRSHIRDGCLGLYHCGTSRIEVLDPDAFANAIVDEGPFAAIPVENYYDSVLTHELAHAAYDDRNCPLATCPVNQEFIAYAMQVRSLSDEDRRLFERSGVVEPSEARIYLSTVMLAMSPERFAAAAWWHFSGQAAPCEYVGAIVSGDVLLDRERPW